MAEDNIDYLLAGAERSLQALERFSDRIDRRLLTVGFSAQAAEYRVAFAATKRQIISSRSIVA